MQNDLKRDYLWNTLGVFAQNAISPLLLVVITRVNGITDSGMFSFAFSVAIIFWALAMWGGRTYQVSDVKNEFSHRSYIMARIVLGLCMLVAAGIFIAVNGYDAMKSGIIITLVVFKIIESFADSVYGILQVRNRLYIVGRSLLYKAAFGFGLFVVFDVLTKNIFLSSLAIVFVNILFVVFYDLRIARKLEDIALHVGKIGRYTNGALIIIRRCAPVAAMIFLSMFSLNIPRYFIDKYHGNEIGYFGILAMPITLIGLVMTFVLQPNMVSLAKMYERHAYDDFNRIVKKLTVITGCIGAVILLVSALIGISVLQLVFGVSFSGYRTALIIMVVGGIINALVTVLINILIIMRHFKAQFYTLLCTNILLAILSAAVVKEHGLLAGVNLFAIANLVQLALLAVSYGAILRRAKM